MERMEALTNYYTTHNEDARLTPKHRAEELVYFQWVRTYRDKEIRSSAVYKRIS